MNRIIIHCGEGRGKSSSAAGVALRSLAHGRKVLAVQFFKPQPDSALLFLQKKISGNLCIKNYGSWYFIDHPDENAGIIFRNALKEIRDLIAGENYDVIILDEILYTTHFKILEEDEIISLLEDFDGKSFILTGRYAPEKLLETADTVSSINCVKHAFDSGIKAQSGIEF